MQLTGKNFIGDESSILGTKAFQAINPTNGQALSPPFFEASTAEVNRALELASQAFQTYGKLSPETRAHFLQQCADEIEALGDDLVERAVQETALGRSRIISERGRTVNQLRMFADLVAEGSWVDARIDRAQPDRQPAPKPDIRRMLIPIGPVVVFGASNFPLAFSVAGGDTASALAAGCSVIVKAHPAHPGTSELVGRAILKAATETGMPEGVFSLLHGPGPEVGLALVRHPLTQAVGFTGSLRAGRALFDAAMTRPKPIPVYAEMGSVNPVFVLPKALAERGGSIAQGLQKSVTLGVGQYCTNPGLIVGAEGSELKGLTKELAALAQGTPPGTMLYPGIRNAYEERVAEFSKTPGVRLSARSEMAPDEAKNEVASAVFETSASTLLGNRALSEEVFGPSTVVATCQNREELLEVARSLEGHLTATIHGTPEELAEYRDLIATLENKVGRLIFNGFPTGVEVCPAMNHGGPYPATTDVHYTSVGTAAIQRFVRPLCYQDFPQEMLPPELRDGNPRGIWRLVDNTWTRDSESSSTV